MHPRTCIRPTCTPPQRRRHASCPEHALPVQCSRDGLCYTTDALMHEQYCVTCMQPHGKRCLPLQSTDETLPDVRLLLMMSILRC